MDEANADAVEKVLGSPVIADLSDHALKIRRNLLAVSSVSIFVAITGVRIDPGSTLLGFHFLGLTERGVAAALMGVTTYFLLHFLWYALDGYMEWKLRVTGTRLGWITGTVIGSEHADYPDDPRQSTLYSWWLQRAKEMGSVQRSLSDVTDKLSQLQTIAGNDGSKGLSMPQAVGLLSELKNDIGRLQRAVVASEKVILSPRIEVSLKRFDGWFQFFLRSQNLRWILLEIVFPVVMGTSATVLLLKAYGIIAS